MSDDMSMWPYSNEIFRSLVSGEHLKEKNSVRKKCRERAAVFVERNFPKQVNVRGKSNESRLQTTLASRSKLGASV